MKALFQNYCNPCVIPTQEDVCSFIINFFIKLILFIELELRLIAQLCNQRQLLEIKTNLIALLGLKFVLRTKFICIKPISSFQQIPKYHYQKRVILLYSKSMVRKKYASLLIISTHKIDGFLK